MNDVMVFEDDDPDGTICELTSDEYQLTLGSTIVRVIVLLDWID